MTVDDYCELCELPLSTCVHGAPPPPPPVARPAAAPRVRAARRTPAEPAKPPVRHRWTPPDTFRGHIVTVLEQAGGELDADDLFLELEVRLDAELTEADRETTPEGELRWRYAARRARQGLVADGLMTKGRPGVWALA